MRPNPSIFHKHEIKRFVLVALENWQGIIVLSIIADENPKRSLNRCFQRLQYRDNIVAFVINGNNNIQHKTFLLLPALCRLASGTNTEYSIHLTRFLLYAK